MAHLENLIVEESGFIAEITINRPQALNALNQGTLAELSQVIADIGRDHKTRAVILRGGGEKAFVAGADISAMAGMGEAEALEFARRGHALGDALGALDAIVIAAVHGFALGGGCELALACDFAFASEKAKFGQPEVKLGVIPGFGGTQRLARRIGAARALELIAVGDPIDAAEALRLGLVNAVVPGGAAEVLAHARAVAHKIAERGPVAVALAKKAVRKTHEVSLEEGNRLEAELFARCFTTADQKEGMKAFLEKRAAAFQGR